MDYATFAPRNRILINTQICNLEIAYGVASTCCTSPPKQHTAGHTSSYTTPTSFTTQVLMTDRRRDSSRRPPDDRNKAQQDDERVYRVKEGMKQMRQQMADENRQHRIDMLKLRDAEDAAREARNRPPPSRGWGSRSNPETDSTSNREHTAAAPAGADPERRSTHEHRLPASREDREGAERGSREYNERSQQDSRRSGMHPPRSLAMPHTDRSQEDTGQRQPPAAAAPLSTTASAGS